MSSCAPIRVRVFVYVSTGDDRVHLHQGGFPCQGRAAGPGVGCRRGRQAILMCAVLCVSSRCVIQTVCSYAADERAPRAVSTLFPVSSRSPLEREPPCCHWCTAVPVVYRSLLQNRLVVTQPRTNRTMLTPAQRILAVQYPQRNATDQQTRINRSWEAQSWWGVPWAVSACALCARFSAAFGPWRPRRARFGAACQ